MGDSKATVNLTDGPSDAVVGFSLHLVVLTYVLTRAVVDSIELNILVKTYNVHDILVTLLLPFFVIFHGSIFAILIFNGNFKSRRLRPSLSLLIFIKYLRLGSLLLLNRGPVVHSIDLHFLKQFQQTAFWL